MGRKPDGRGRRAKQARLRGKRARWLAKQIFQRLDIQRVERTLTIVPSICSLKKRRWRRIFSVLSMLKGRVYTAQLCRDTIVELVRLLPFRLNPEGSFSSYVQAQGQQLCKLARSIKKMDGLDTQALDAEARVYLV